MMIHWRVRGLLCEPKNKLNVLYHFRNWGWGCARNTSLTLPVIHYWPFQGDSFVMVLSCLVFVSEFPGRFTLCVFIIFLVRFGLLSDHLLGNSCSLGWPYVLFFIFWRLVILFISNFGFEAWIWALIQSLVIAYFLSFNLIMVEGYGALFSCTAVVQALDSMTELTWILK